MRSLAIRYCIAVALLLGGYAVVAQTQWFERDIVEPHLEFVASGTGLFLGAIGESVTVEGTVVHSRSFSFQTARGCDAIGAVVIVSALIFAFPATLRSKLIGVALCGTTLALANFLRTTSLTLIGTYHADLYEIAHRDVWQTVFAVLCIALFIVWIRVSAVPAEAH